MTAADVVEALRGVLDPELGMSVVDLGLIYEIEVTGDAVRIRATATTPGCPLRETLAAGMHAAVARVPGADDVTVTMTFDPPWTPDRIGQLPVISETTSGSRTPGSPLSAPRPPSSPR
jgi:metal-sulfur cluster biosynthetic enzyme